MSKHDIFEQRNEFIRNYGTLKFTRFDPEIAAKKMNEEWNCLPYRINISCDYINPLYKKYKSIVAPGIPRITDAQRYDFECIIISIAQENWSPVEKIKKAEEWIESIKNNTYDYIPYTFNENCKYPVRAIGTIYQGIIKSVDVKR